MQLSSLLTFASFAFARFSYEDIAPNSGKSGLKALASEPIKCNGILPCPKKVKCTDVLTSGFLTTAFRRSASKCQDKILGFNDAVVICTKRSCCRLISRERFMKAVIATMRAMNKNHNAEIPKQAIVVIDHIYNAAFEIEASIDALISFTCIALHNMHIFFKFTAVDMYNVIIGETCRGLLQFKSYTNYQKLNSVSRIDYIARPYLLDRFSAESILDEFKAYSRFYYNHENATKVSKFINAIHRLAPNESPYVTEQTAYEIALGVYKPRNPCEAKVLQRFTIYNTLSLYVFGTEEISVKIIEN